MSVNVNKVIKAFAIGAILYYCMDFCYDLGKGRMLGTIARDCPEVNEALQKLSDWKPDNLSDGLKVAIVTTAAKLKMEEP